MESAKPRFKKYIFVCENVREEGASCGARGSSRLRELLKDAVQRKGLAGVVRVSRSGCLDVCAEGPNVLVVPDYIWFKRVGEADVAEILKKAAESVREGV